MKPITTLLPVCALLVFTACSTPEQRAANRQRDLQEQAQERLEEEKELEQERAEDIAEARRDAEKEDQARARHVAKDPARFRAYEAEYARQLGKKPSQLTPSERQWVQDHF